MKTRYVMLALGMAAMSAATAQVGPKPQTQARSAEEQKTMPPTSSTASVAVDTRETFGGLDKDKDGRVSSTEAGADASFDAGFAAMDANGDGFVSDTEYRAQARASGKMEDKQPSRPM